MHRAGSWTRNPSSALDTLCAASLDPVSTKAALPFPWAKGPRTSTMDAPARSDASRRKLRTAAPSSRSTLGSDATTTTASSEHRGGAWVRRNCAYAAMASRGHGNSASVSTTGRGRRIQSDARNASKAFLHGPAVSSSESSADASEAWPVFASETWPPESRGSILF